MDEEIKGFKEQKVRENKASAQGSLPVLTELEQVPNKGEQAGLTHLPGPWATDKGEVTDSGRRRAS